MRKLLILIPLALMSCDLGTQEVTECIPCDVLHMAALHTCMGRGQYLDETTWSCDDDNLGCGTSRGFRCTDSITWPDGPGQ